VNYVSLQPATIGVSLVFSDLTAAAGSSVHVEAGSGQVTTTGMISSKPGDSTFLNIVLLNLVNGRADASLSLPFVIHWI
jgi:hypothetical protein